MKERGMGKVTSITIGKRGERRMGEEPTKKFEEINTRRRRKKATGGTGKEKLRE